MSQEGRCRRFSPWVTAREGARRDASRGMTKRLITALAVALATAVALGLIGLASGRATAATEPTLTLTRDCEIYREFGADGILDTHDRNRISCGKGIDKVKTIAKSEVASNCEHVRIRRDFDEPR